MQACAKPCNLRKAQQVVAAPCLLAQAAGAECFEVAGEVEAGGASHLTRALHNVAAALLGTGRVRLQACSIILDCLDAPHVRLLLFHKLPLI